MDPEQMIQDLSSLIGAYNRFGSHLRAEAEQIEEEWSLLGQAGGQRADHAAQLLSRLRPILRDAAAFCRVAEQQIDEMVADPFQRRKENRG